MELTPGSSIDGTMEGTALKEWQEHVQDATKFTGVPWTNVPNYKRWFVEAGFEDVTEVNFRWPSNQWSKDRRERLLGACEYLPLSFLECSRATSSSHYLIGLRQISFRNPVVFWGAFNLRRTYVSTACCCH